MAVNDASQEAALLKWYQSVLSRRVDLVGDYAGNELFLIEGDSLLLHCLSDSEIDFQDGFQLLHTVHTVELFLRNLSMRKCNFHVVFFDAHESADALLVTAAAKYHLTRAVIIRHLRRNLPSDTTIKVLCFPSFQDAAFVRYISHSGLFFVMCHDGAGLCAEESDNFDTIEGDTSGSETSKADTSEGDTIGRPWLDISEPEDETDSEEEEASVNQGEEVSLGLEMSNGRKHEKTVFLRAMIFWFISHGYNVALINALDFVDTKVMTLILESSRVNDPITIDELRPQEIKIYGPKEKSDYCFERLEKALENTSSFFSERDFLTIISLQTMLEEELITEQDILLILLHTASLCSRSLSLRRFKAIPPEFEKQNVLDLFVFAATKLLRKDSTRGWLNDMKTHCDLADLIDGRLLAHLYTSEDYAAIFRDDFKAQKKFRELVNLLSEVSGRKILSMLEPKHLAKSEHRRQKTQQSSSDSVLLFENPVFTKYLSPIHLVVNEPKLFPLSSRRAKIFKELSHWHNSKRAITEKGAPPKANFFARRRNQWFMAEMLTYAASLTNAAGKVLDPETIVSGGPDKTQKKLPHAHQSMGKERGKQEIVQVPKPQKQPGKQTKGGKAAALEAAAAVRAEKSKSKTSAGLSFWKAACKDLESRDDMQRRYTDANKYYDSLSDEAKALIGPEVELFMIECLIHVWSSFCQSSKEDGLSIAALIWSSFLRLSKVETGMTKAIASELEIITKLMSFPRVRFIESASDRPLAFGSRMRQLQLELDKMNKKSSYDLSIPGSISHFQLSECGPYFDRSIDSAPDARVPFMPDGWQRKVLDAIDQRKSLFVVAPTSAGKTFISFYAMKKVLESNEDDVIVYVAPTKALVNQIAAEVQARFSKSFKHAGRSVWGIHTRDYRINNPIGCQVLVTVPHILQIMLLAPSHAEKKSSWSYRVKRIIFDEIHCIGQAEDGVVWEQLLLQTQCPLIALSATVGNPGEFSDWLASTQRANGIELVTVEHHHRYSDLRKFIFRPPAEFCFEGLPDRPIINTPGLDGSPGFSFIHPVASLVNTSRGMPDDLTLEARDCLLLWKSMSKHQSKAFPLKSSLDPLECLPDVIRKVDIHQWETKLKTLLRKWMANPQSPFEAVREELSGDLNQHPTCKSPETLLETDQVKSNRKGRSVCSGDVLSTTLPMLAELHSKEALPAILFCYDRYGCEAIALTIFKELEGAEIQWKANNSAWKKKVVDFEKWVKDQEATTSRAKTHKKLSKSSRRDGDDSGEIEKISKADRARDGADSESVKWATFDPSAPIQGFHFADPKKLSTSDLKQYQAQLRARKVPELLVKALSRGVGVHHAGMNRKYRQVVEILFRKGYLRVVIATGTLALGINMPCKTVVFSGDSVFLTALNYRQAAGRAGRRGFDVLGNVVFQNIEFDKVCRLMSSRLPDLNGHFPITTSLVLRLFTLLHESKESEFAVRTIDSILSQPRLYLGSPESKVAVLHHLRFSIEYLRRQCLLSRDGAPLNFAGCVSHLYYTENSSWAFHALLKEGYFHKLCAGINKTPKRVCRTLMLVLAHIFGRLPCPKATEEFVEEMVKRSPSVVFLPDMPKQAEKVLRKHNLETLDIFKTYVRTFVDQHLSKEPDNKLPLTRLAIGSEEGNDGPSLSSMPAPIVRSPFVALSGHGDDFTTVSELCRTVRAGVFLENAVIPHLPIFPKESPVPLNAYLYDFYKHGDITALRKANKIRPGDVWFLLNDFSLVLATIVTSLTNFMKLSPDADTGVLDVMGSLEAFDEQQDDKAYVNEERKQEQDAHGAAVGGAGDPRGQDLPLRQSNSLSDGASCASPSPSRPAWEADGGGLGLLKVLKAFRLLSHEFNEKFKAMWA